MRAHRQAPRPTGGRDGHRPLGCRRNSGAGPPRRERAAAQADRPGDDERAGGARREDGTRLAHRGGGRGRARVSAPRWVCGGWKSDGEKGPTLMRCRLPVVSCLTALFLACARTAAPPPPAAPIPPPAPVVEPEPLAKTLDQAKELRAAGNLQLYEHSLQALSSSPDGQTSHRAMALLALFYIDQKRADEAIAALGRTADVYPEVAPWLRLREMELQRDSAKYADAINGANRIVQEAPSSSAATIARVRLPALYALGGNTTGAENALREALL